MSLGGSWKKSSKERADGQAASLDILVLLAIFFLNPMKSLHTQQSHRNANQNYEVLPHTGQNDLCQKVYKQ